MQSFRATSGPFEQQLRFTPEEIDRICRDALVHEKLLPTEPEPVRIDRFVEKHFNCQISYEDLGEGILGCTLFNPNGSVKVVGISSRLDDDTVVGKRRERATVAHEAGHGLMHTTLFMPSLDQGRLNITPPARENLDFKERRILCRDSDVKEATGGLRGYDGRWWEWQANRAIGGLLLPRSLVQKAIVHFLDTSSITATPSLKTAAREAAVANVAEVFDVNPAVARIRLSEMFPEAGGQMSF
jgi:hypothetical protein